MTEGFSCEGFEVFMAVTMKNAVFWDVVPCAFIINRRFGVTYHPHLHCRREPKQESGVKPSVVLQKIGKQALGLFYILFCFIYFSYFPMY
jgi:hypothetical protein